MTMTIRSILSAILFVASLIPSEAALPLLGKGNPAVADAIKAYATPGTHFDAPNAKIDKDIAHMLRKMTLREKVGQMTQLNQDQIQLPDGTFNWTKVEYLAKNYNIGSYLNNMNAHGINFNVQGYADAISRINEITLSVKSTYKIPIIYGLDTVHGAHYIANATIFPHGIAQAASFNPNIAYGAAEIAAKDSRAANIHWTFAPILDLGVNKQWPRVYENFGEDPYLQSVMAAASVHGFQGNYKTNRTKIAACMKHFIGYGAPRSGEDRDSSWIPDRFLYDYFVPSFKAAIDAGVATGMESYIDINGVPVVGSEQYLKTLLRDQLQFHGMLVTDWHEIENLFSFHGVASSVEAATLLSMEKTSIDMSMVPQDLTFPDIVYTLVKSGVLPESRVDESAGRVLQLKKDLGLLEPDGWVTNNHLLATVGQASDYEVAIDVAREVLALLKNANNTLPLGNDVKNLLVVGPTATKLSYLAGGWTIYWQGSTIDGYQGAADDKQFYGHGISILSGIQENAPKGTKVTYIEGVDITGATTDSLDKVLKAAKAADAVIACIGEHPYAELPGNIHDITLAQGQIDLVTALSSVSDKLVLLLTEGRPRVIGDAADVSQAVLHTFLPGPWAGRAIGEVIFGKTNPSGRLPYTYPRYPGDQGLNYWRQVSDNLSWNPLFEFGTGTSFSKMSYSNITLSSLYLTPTHPVRAYVTVTNEGPWDGKEVVMMFIAQPFRRVSPPTKLLKGFDKVFIANGKSETIEFEITADMFRYTGIDNIPYGSIDAGVVNVLIGPNTVSLELRV